MMEREILQPFRPRARILRLLGDELIGNPRLAVFELVKNAYDADANEVVVRLDLDKQKIVVRDDGEGMTLDTLRNVWLVPGHDHRDLQRREVRRSPRHHRLPLGEKGLGRFAVHKLGDRISLVTRAADNNECIVNIDWQQLIDKPFLEDAPVRIRERTPEVFTGRSTGTRIIITQLRQEEWTRGEVRRLFRQITSICSPFEEPAGFKARLEVTGRERWLDDLPDVREIMARAPWRFAFRLEGGRFDWTYEFRQMPGLKLDGRKKSGHGDTLKVTPLQGHSEAGAKREIKVVADANSTTGIGPVSGEFYVFDRDREVLSRLPNMQFIKEYLDENGGVRVYRDGIRVYNYGEPGDDWLGLDLRRVNVPTRRISRNIILGAIHLSLGESSGLVEKTNREGFVDNDASERLQQIVLAALGAFEPERMADKDRIRALTSKARDTDPAGIGKPIAELRKALTKRGFGQDFEPFISKIEHDYSDMQNTLLSAGMSGLNLAVVFHEVERGVRALHQVITEGHDFGDAADQARNLMLLLDGFSTLLRRDAKATHSARKLIDAMRQFNLLRFRHHRVQLVCPFLEGSDRGFEAKYVFNLVVGALNNLIDNSIYWMRVRWPEVQQKGSSSPRKLYIGLSDDFESGPAIVIADTGTGFQDDEPERLVRPFFTRKPSGMGLGLYYSNLAMELSGGMLVFPEPGEVELPDGFDGAVVALVFGRRD